MNAFLIICHKNSEQVMRLVERCKTANTDVFIHADINMNDNQFKELVNLADGDGVFMTEKRIHCELDKRTLVDAAMLLVATAQRHEVASGVHYDYYALLSGQDYLIKPMSYIEGQLKELYPIPLIDCTPWSNSNWVSQKFSKNKKLLAYREWIDKTYPVKKGMAYCLFRGIGFVWRKIVQISHKSDYDYFKASGVDLYGGSAWWILPDKVINQIVSEYETAKDYVERLLATLTPEETFFQIITMRTEFADMVRLNPVDSREQTCKTFAYFSDVDKPFCGHPYTITINNIDMLSNMPEYWIARKFEINEDKEILDYIDHNLLQEEVIQ